MRKIFSGVGRLPLFMGDGNLGESLDKENRWYKLADRLPWADIERIYNATLDPRRKGATNLPARLVIGALLIKHIEDLTDRGAITAIQENPYMQYFVGLTHFTTTPIFDPSLFVTIRKRLSAEEINKITLLLMKAEKNEEDEHSNGEEDSDEESSSNPTNSSKEEEDEQQEPSHLGSVVVDATCCTVEIPYPNDLRIIYESIQQLCKIRSAYGEVCDKEQKELAKISLEAKKKYHGYTLRKSKPKGGLKRVLKEMLHLLHKTINGFLGQFAHNSTALVEKLSERSKRYIQTILKVYHQQYGLHQKGEKIKGRIVNIHQPHIRPIVRGKAGRNVEFGPKVNISVVGGYTLIDHLSYDSFNEGTKLEEQIKLYRERFGCLPEKVLADRIYLNKANCQYMSENNITPIGKRLGRPKKQEKTEEERKEMHQRNIVEGTFGTVKRTYGAERVKTMLPKTTEVAVAMSFLAKNVMKFLRVLPRLIFSWLFSTSIRPIFQHRTPLPAYTPVLAWGGKP